MNGLIIKAISSFYYVDYENRIIECRARGNFRKSGVSPIVGDKVEISLIDDNHGVIEKIHERKNSLLRPLISNIDKILIISSFECPSPDTLIIDRLTANAVYCGIEPIIVFNKCDTGDFSEYERIYKNAGFKTYVVSAKDNIGIDNLKSEISNCITAFAGNSGVGKSSLINLLLDNLNLPVGDVSIKLGRGRHTTRQTELFKTKFGGYVADTPGFSSFESEIGNYDFKQNLVYTFPDFADYINNCKFNDCTHTCEKGCGLLEALNSGKIEITRHNSYVELFNELKGLKQWNSNLRK